MPVGRQAAIVAAVTFVIGIGVGLKWGPFSSRHGKPIQTPVAHHAGVDAGRPAMASSEMMTPTPPDARDTPTEATEATEAPEAPEAPEAIDAGLDTTPPEKQPQPTHPVEPSKRKRSNGRDGSKHKVAPPKVDPPTPPTDSFDPFGSPD